ncbi:phosphomethylpyrimidine kinase [Defluviimonas sp. 20V17]|uniref:hydroxymethylpyrimidine kinase n=1 Tax=Allgaiera indica TaxID=765699 RepID=A0AAN5A0S3_9RHOB|nr:hydroxymethylpyrimidine/phosphomethylpyrimidine kinase [Allgaiera indica]KDB04796.1 phosphomethylpyrimidine kinase [Defluviimonas sp. 20V17]GHE05087.1 hydroxymethylpyrimidine/phosphomethylpyrimidine kinase [Allgaiera indica]SDX66900.1 hydroxymethylpyrimidine/phosphomethylpyrimidine kinase [Allgaiera indica]
MKPALLCIGGMDSSAGAGLLRDTVTAAEFGLICRVAVTAVTAQTDRAVSAVHPVPPDVVAAQIFAGAPGAGAVKIGMLGNGAIVRAVAAALAETSAGVPLVLDPVLRSSSGRDLLDRAGLSALIETLLPRAALLTPNLPELRALGDWLDLPFGTGEEAIVAALQARGAGAVLVKGGHAETAKEARDRLYLPGGRIQEYTAPRQALTLRGTGCHLACAVAAGLALGQPLQVAVGRAKESVAARFALPARVGGGGGA